MEEIGFGVRGQEDPRIYVQTLEFLMNIHSGKEDLMNPRMDSQHERVKIVTGLFKKFFHNTKISNFDDVCSRTFQFIYKMCHQPNIIAEEIITDLWTEMKVIAEKFEGAQEDGEEKDLQKSSMTLVPFVRPSQNGIHLNKTPLTLPVFLLSRFIFMIGYIAMRELIYLDIDIYSNLRYRQELADTQKNKKKDQKTGDKGRRTLNMSATAVMRKSIIPPALLNNEEEENREDDVIGPSAEDAFAEQINMICEHELLFDRESVFRWERNGIFNEI